MRQANSWHLLWSVNNDGSDFRKLDTVNGNKAEEQEQEQEQEQPCSSSSPTEVEETEDEEGEGDKTKADNGSDGGKQEEFRRLIASLIHKQQNEIHANGLPTVI